MNEDQILMEMQSAKEIASQIQADFEKASKNFYDVQNIIAVIVDEAAKAKENLVFENFSEDVAKTFEEVQRQRALIRELLFKSLDTEVIDENTVAETIGGYGTAENDLEDACSVFESQFEDFLEKFLDEFSCCDRRINAVLRTNGEFVWDKFSKLLKERNKDLYTRLRPRIFTFEDIPNLCDRDIQRVLRCVDTTELALSLKEASQEVQDKFFHNMSERAANMIREDMKYMSVYPKRMQEAREKILRTIFRLSERGDLILRYPGRK